MHGERLDMTRLWTGLATLVLVGSWVVDSQAQSETPAQTSDWRRPSSTRAARVSVFLAEGRFADRVDTSSLRYLLVWGGDSRDYPLFRLTCSLPAVRGPSSRHLERIPGRPIGVGRRQGVDLVHVGIQHAEGGRFAASAR